MALPIIIEAVGRLPGPLAASMLLRQGLKVVKLEEINRPDPFSGKVDTYMGPMFNNWYQTMKEGKAHLKILDGDQTFIDQIERLICDHQEVVFLSGEKKCPLQLTIEELKKILNHKKIKWAHIKIASDEAGTPLHDLDLATSVGLVNNDQKTPLRYPVVGMQFAALIAQRCLTMAKEKTIDTLYFEKEIIDLYKCLPQEMTPSPIQGQVLGYNTYKIKDGRISLTALEKRSWVNFIKTLSIPLAEHDRFLKSGTPQEKILQKVLQTVTINCLDQMVKKGARCFTYFK